MNRSLPALVGTALGMAEVMLEGLMPTSHSENTLRSDEEIGQWLKVYRAMYDLSQQDVADMLGRTQPSVSLIEAGRRKLTAAEYLALVERRNEGTHR